MMRITFSGNVQGVGFRWHVKRTAERLSIKGYVKNLPTGTVEAVCHGKDEIIDAFIESCKKGSLGTIEHTYKEHVAGREIFTSFSIRQ